MLKKADLIKRLQSPSVPRVANAVRLLISDYKMTQREIAKAGERSLFWVNAMSRWTPDKRSPFGPTTKADRVLHAKRGHFKRRNRKRNAETKGQKTDRRWAKRSSEGRSAKLLPENHPAATESRTVYPTTRRDVSPDTRVLKSGANNSKIGGKILKGHWKNFPIYMLTLEERATCPQACGNWLSCYGDKLHLAHRMKHGLDLELQLEQEVAAHAEEHRQGFAVRLHVLGDFYSVEYVELWRHLLKRHPALHIWGYTARWNVKKDPMAAALVALVKDQPDRFKMRFSDAPDSFELPATKTVQRRQAAADDAIVCPEQVGKTESCSTCGFCWQSTKRVGFVQH
jgi:hypothetical protein